VNVLDLFSGTGGFSLGLEAAGMHTVAFCEADPNCRELLAYRWPGIPIYDDIRTLTGEQVEREAGRIDVVCGGFPCQPFSVAGKRIGIHDDRHLWPEMLRIIRELRPTWVIGENVAGIGSMALDAGEIVVENRSITLNEDGDHYASVLSRQEKMLLYAICEDLEEAGYDVQPFNIPACAVGAPHRRHRVWIVAYTKRHRASQSEGCKRNQRRRTINSGEVCDTTAARLIKPRLGGGFDGIPNRLD
jgi:DNA (cytosine-5)-methyltransferase 1